jgi:hypothetical protein
MLAILLTVRSNHNVQTEIGNLLFELIGIEFVLVLSLSRLISDASEYSLQLTFALRAVGIGISRLKTERTSE